MGYAESVDGINFKRRANPVLLNAGAIDVTKLSKNYLMVIESGEGTFAASSPDGLTWQRNSSASISKDSWSSGHVTPHLFIQDGFLRLFYGEALMKDWNHNQIRSIGNLLPTTFGLDDTVPQPPVVNQPPTSPPQNIPRSPLPLSRCESTPAIWSCISAMDGNNQTSLSSQISATSQINGRFWIAARTQSQVAVSEVCLTARSQGNGQILAFPKSYRIYFTDAQNSRWVDQGVFQTQPDHGGTVRIPFHNIKSYRVMIAPIDLGTDNFGSFYFQLNEIELFAP